MEKRRKKKLTQEQKRISEEGYRLFQERMNLPGCARTLTPEEVEELRKEGRI